MSPLLKRIAYGEHMSEINVRIIYSLLYPRILSAIALELTRAHCLPSRFFISIYLALEIRPIDIHLACSSIRLAVLSFYQCATHLYLTSTRYVLLTTED